MVADLAFTFAPVRVAHAAYHVHISQADDHRQGGGICPNLLRRRA